MKRKMMLGLLLISLPIELFANGMNAHFSTGVGWARFSHTDNLYLNSFVENSYATSNTTSAPFASAGIGYLWNNPFSKTPQLAFLLGVSGYYTRYTVSGTNSPFINMGQFDTLTYHVKDTSTSLLIEPEIIYTHFQTLQPYVLGGLGIAWNHAGDYTESPTRAALSAAPMPVPFQGNTMTNLAYEIGAGVKTTLYKNTHHIINIYCDYRYINWGKLELNPSPLQTTAKGPYLGLLKTQLINIGLEYQIV